ncbi:MAG: HD domain-containing protein, partial [Candidatus Lokiarchaeota archaeon]|nr:HD domain-containing protein [Candidatus Lokiarchaeota archaeon]
MYNNIYYFIRRYYYHQFMEKKQILELMELVKEACFSDNNKFGPDIWKNHILDVIHFSKLLAKELGADEEIVELAALFHDYASVKDYRFYEDHHIFGARFAAEILSSTGMEDEKITAIRQCILSHRSSVFVEKDSVEARILASADAMSHFNNIRSLFVLAVERHGMSREEAINWLDQKLKRSYEKVMPEGRKFIEEQKKSCDSIRKLEAY